MLWFRERERKKTSDSVRAGRRLTIAGYLLFYGALLFLSRNVITGISPLWILLGLFVAFILFDLLTVKLMKKLFDFDPAFMFHMPILAYALYRMFLDFILLFFLFAVLRPLSVPMVIGIVGLVGIFYLFGVLRHWSRLNRMMIEGRLPGDGSRS